MCLYFAFHCNACYTVDSIWIKINQSTTTQPLLVYQFTKLVNTILRIASKMFVTTQGPDNVTHRTGNQSSSHQISWLISHNSILLASYWLYVIKDNMIVSAIWSLIFMSEFENNMRNHTITWMWNKTQNEWRIELCSDRISLVIFWMFRLACKKRHRWLYLF